MGDARIGAVLGNTIGFLVGRKGTHLQACGAVHETECRMFEAGLQYLQTEFVLGHLKKEIHKCFNQSGGRVCG
jgi:hypothetical protein